MTTSPDERWQHLRDAVREIPRDRISECEPLFLQMFKIAESFGFGDSRLQESHYLLLHHYRCDVGDYDKAQLVCRYWLARERDGRMSTKYDRSVMLELASILWVHPRQPGNPESASIYRQVLALAEDAYGEGHPQTAGPLFQLAQYLRNVKQFDESARYYERLVELRERTGRTSDVTSALSSLGEVYLSLGRHADAERILRHSLNLKRQDSTDTGGIGHGLGLSRLASVVATLGRVDEALVLMDEAIALTRADYDQMIVEAGEYAHSLTDRMFERTLRKEYADLLRRAGRLPEAETIYRELLAAGPRTESDERLIAFWKSVPLGRALMAASFGESRSKLLAGLADVLRDDGRDDEAAPVSAEADDLAARAAALRVRINRLMRKQWLRDPSRQSPLTTDDVRRMLETSA